MKNESQITEYIAKLPVWQQAVMTQLRNLLHEVDPDIKETFKWGAPTYEDAGIVIWTFAVEKWVHVSFPQGKLLDHQHGLFEESLDDPNTKAKRTIKLREGDAFPAGVLKPLITQAIANNRSGNKVIFEREPRQEIELPHDVATELKSAGLEEAYWGRPYYQQKGYLQWLDAAKRPETRTKRLHKMIQELGDGTYMPPADS